MLHLINLKHSKKFLSRFCSKPHISPWSVLLNINGIKNQCLKVSLAVPASLASKLNYKNVVSKVNLSSQNFWVIIFGVPSSIYLFI